MEEKNRKMETESQNSLEARSKYQKKDPRDCESETMEEWC